MPVDSAGRTSRLTKLIYVLLDGVGDLPDPNLNEVTPLEAAYTPALDSIARRGMSGLVHSVGKDIAPESDIAVFNMLSYSFPSGYMGRGVVEAVGAGLRFQDGYLALRGNFATINSDGVIIDRRAGRDLKDADARALARAVSDKLRFKAPKAQYEFLHTVGHRATLVIRYEGFDLSAEISNTDPAYARVHGVGVALETRGPLEYKKCVALEDTESSRISANLVNEFTEKACGILEEHPINRGRVAGGRMPGNIVLLRDAGNRIPRLKPLAEKFNMKFVSLVDMPVEKGISKMLGVTQADAGAKEDYVGKASNVLRLLREFDAVYIHIKGPDEPGHDGDARLKKRVIEDIDRGFFKPLVEKTSADRVAIAVSADHSTPCQMKGHSADPVPLLVAGGRVRKDGTCRFTEKDASRGSLGTLMGAEVLPKIASMI